MSRIRDQDACPGALSVHHAADGALARIRLPGGALSAAQLAALARIATEYGSPAMELTSRGNIQIRGISDAAAVAEAVAAAGLLPSPTHETVRNVVASPLSGRVGGVVDIRTWVTRLDTAIQSDPGLAALPGRFLFGIDDGRGDISALGADVGLHALGDTAAVLLAGHDSGIRVPVGDAVPTMVSIARRFTVVRGSAWRVSELRDPEETAALLAELPTPTTPVELPTAPAPPIGWLDQHDGRVALGAGVPLGVLDARVAEYLAVIEAPLVITPWRSVLVCDLDDGVADAAVRVLAPLGLIFDAGSPWLQVSACTGRPGCAQSAADVRADAAAAVHVPAARHRHFVGCDRACGAPTGADVHVATTTGYQLRPAQP